METVNVLRDSTAEISSGGPLGCARRREEVPLSLFLLGRIYFLLDDQLQSFGPPV